MSAGMCESRVLGEASGPVALPAQHHLRPGHAACPNYQYITTTTLLLNHTPIPVNIHYVPRIHPTMD